ncbi:interferon alpha/beta receptor 2-like [Astyanax mexicanus]|uniref:Interferon alpha/beta receptor 2-like n=1 Tax=Astyanax mexicanus TaxID=7994 RepID=A0A8T2LN24_ASTMX|nr:interferon alpha/beta receptor 2-like [Astyanax mexicanus]
MDGVHLPLLLIVMLPTLSNSVLCMHLPAPAKLSMDSHHFVHLLSWEPGLGSPEGVSYTVDVCVLSEKGRSCNPTHCSSNPDQSPLQCNLTEVFRLPNQIYYTIVSASLGNVTSSAYFPPFQPFKDTVPEPPRLKVLPCNESLCVHLQAPYERLLSVYNCTVYPCFKYKLNISSNGQFKFMKEVQGLQTVVLEHLVPGQEYCVSVGIKDRSSSYRPAVCAFTAAAESRAGAPIFAAVCVIVLLFLWGFVVLSWIFYVKSHLPAVLSSFQGPYKEQLMGFPTVESLHSISLEPDTVKGIETDEGAAEDEDPEDESVAYERLGNQSGTCSGTCGQGSSSTQTLSDQGGNGYDRTQHSKIEIPSSPVPMAISSILPPTTSREHMVKPQLRTGFGLQQKPVNPPAGELSSTALGLFHKQLRHTGLSILAHRHRDKEQQDAEEEEEEGINVNLCSLRLGGQIEEDQLKKEGIPKQVIPTSLQKVEENTTQVQPMCSPSSERNVTDLQEKDDEEDEDEEEEEDSGYMMRN